MKKQLNKKELKKTNGGLCAAAYYIYATIYNTILIEKGEDEAEKYLYSLHDISNDDKRIVRHFASRQKRIIKQHSLTLHLYS